MREHGGTGRAPPPAPGMPPPAPPLVDLYRGVIDEVVARAKPEFVQEGVDE